MQRMFDADAHRATRQAPFGAHRLRVDSQIIDLPTCYQIVTPSDRSGSLNEILRADVADMAEFDALCAPYRDRGLAFKVCVWPWSKPANLHETLAARGSEHWRARGMYIDTQTNIEPAHRVERVHAARDCEHFAHVWACGWKEPIAAALTDTYAMLERADLDLFVAYLEDEPAGVALCRHQPDYGYLMGAVVLPTCRGRGLYRSLIAARLDWLATNGVRIAVTHAREATSAPILARLGFDTAFRYRMHRILG